MILEVERLGDLATHVDVPERADHAAFKVARVLGPSIVMPGVPASAPDSRIGASMPSAQCRAVRQLDLVFRSWRADDAHIRNAAARPDETHGFFGGELLRLGKRRSNMQMVSIAKQLFDELRRQMYVWCEITTGTRIRLMSLAAALEEGLMVNFRRLRLRIAHGLGERDELLRRQAEEPAQRCRIHCTAKHGSEVFRGAEQIDVLADERRVDRRIEAPLLGD